MEEPVAEGEVCLHLGSGNIYWPQWINVDAHSERADLKCDIRSLPYIDNSVSRVCAIHVIEHFYFWEVSDLLWEWKRALKPGGKIILELPCMDSVLGHIGARLRKGMPPSPTMSWYPLWGDPRYKRPEMCHKWGYFKYDMQTILAKAGFVDIKDEEPRYHFKVRDMRFTATKPEVA